MEMLKRFIKDERGLEASEYALLLALIVVAVATAVYTLKEDIVTAFDNAETAIEAGNSGTDPSL